MTCYGNTSTECFTCNDDYYLEESTKACLIIGIINEKMFFPNFFFFFFQNQNQ